MRILFLLCGLWPTLLFANHGTELEPLVKDLLTNWDRVTYQQTGDARLQGYAALTERIAGISQVHPDIPELLILEGVTLSAWAEIAPRIKALKLIGRARDVLELAVDVNPDAMEGSAFGTLGALYAKAPGWPLSFGNDDKAQYYFEEAFRRNPDGIDVNYYYAEYLAEAGEEAKAVNVLKRALDAPVLDWRPVGEAGRRAQIRSLLQSLGE